jgi:hypothetical protein
MMAMKPAVKHALAAINVVLSLAAPVAAGPYEDAAAAYNGGDYAAALRLLRPLANQGNAGAQFNLGLSPPRLGCPSPALTAGSFRPRSFRDRGLRGLYRMELAN